MFIEPKQYPILLYGPYAPLKDGYSKCTVQYDNGDIKWVNYHRYIYEKEYGRLEIGWDVHHIDENKNNISLLNLEALIKKEHYQLHKNKNDIECKCNYCGAIFFLKPFQYRYKIKKNERGLYCSKYCSAKDRIGIKHAKKVA